MKAVRKVTAQTDDRPGLCLFSVTGFYGNEEPVNVLESGASLVSHQCPAQCKVRLKANAV